MTGIVKTDQLQGAQSTTITIPTGNKISITDSATIGTLNATTMKGVTTFPDSSVFSGVTSLKLNCSDICYAAASSAIFSAFLTASSIVPTI